MNKLREVDKTISISKQPKDYKKFKMLDPTGITTNDPIISLIINKNNFMFGVDDYLNFYFGRVDDDRKTRLIRVTNTDSGYRRQGIGGFFKYERRLIIGSCATRFNILLLDGFYEEIKNMNCSGELFDIIEDENIPDFEVLISAAYSACCKNNSHFPNNIAYVLENFNKKSHSISRVRKF